MKIEFDEPLVGCALILFLVPLAALIFLAPVWLVWWGLGTFGIDAPFWGVAAITLGLSLLFGSVKHKD